MQHIDIRRLYAKPVAYQHPYDAACEFPASSVSILAQDPPDTFQDDRSAHDPRSSNNFEEARSISVIHSGVLIASRKMLLQLQGKFY